MVELLASFCRDKEVLFTCSALDACGIVDYLCDIDIGQVEDDFLEQYIVGNRRKLLGF